MLSPDLIVGHRLGSMTTNRCLSL